MKKNNIFTYLLLFSVLVLSSCEKFLEVAPDERLEINSLDDINATIAGVYQNERGYRFTHFSSDDVTLATNVFEKPEIIEDLYTWSREFRTETHQDAPAAFWNMSYYAISQVNHALQAIDKYEPNSNEEIKLGALKGEALVARSYNHFMLANIFGKHYGRSANSDLAVPYVTEPETKLEVNYVRNTVEEVYQLAEADMLEGIKLLEVNFKEVNKNKYRFTLATAYAYATRFYLFRASNLGDLEACSSYGEKALAMYGGLEAMRPWSDYSNDGLGPIDIGQAEVGMVQVSATWIPFSFVYQSTFDKQRELQVNPFNLTDHRLRSSFSREGDIYIPSEFFNFNLSNFNTSASDLFPLAEVILNTAEAYAATGDFEKTKLYLQTIGKNAYQDYVPEGLTTQKLKDAYDTDTELDTWLAYILFERRVQLFMKGFRWFDLKRFQIDVTHKLKEGGSIKLSDVAPNYDYQIPSYAISAGMQANP